jgi:hypothetical protein
MTNAKGDISGPFTVIAGHSASEDASERAYDPAIQSSSAKNVLTK